MTEQLSGRVAVVIGASRGIGKGIAWELGAAGAQVFAVGRSMVDDEGGPSALAKAVDQMQAAGFRVDAAPCDVTDDEAVGQLFARCVEQTGRLDILVNSAFDSPQFRASIGETYWELPISVWRDVFDVGTRSAYVTGYHATPYLLQSGDGLIVNVSARGAATYRYNVAYGVGKAALDRMARDMAIDLGDRPLSVISLWPATIRTEHMDAMFASGDSLTTALGDIDELETPRYVGRAVVGLAADPNVKHKTGQRWWVAELAAEYGFVDENGRAHEPPETPVVPPR